MATVCCVCGHEAGGAHTCLSCKMIVHVICGKPKGEEGYGQRVICQNCLKDGEGSSEGGKEEGRWIEDEYGVGLRDDSEVEKKEEEVGVEKKKENSLVEIPAHLWDIFPKRGECLKRIIQFSGFEDVDSVLRLKRPEEVTKMFNFVIEMIDIIPNKEEMFRIFAAKPEKVRITPGLQGPFQKFLAEVEKLKPKEKSVIISESPHSSKRKGNAIDTITLDEIKIQMKRRLQEKGTKEAHIHLCSLSMEICSTCFAKYGISPTGAASC